MYPMMIYSDLLYEDLLLKLWSIISVFLYIIAFYINNVSNDINKTRNPKDMKCSREVWKYDEVKEE